MFNALTEAKCRRQLAIFLAQTNETLLAQTNETLLAQTNETR